MALRSLFQSENLSDNFVPDLGYILVVINMLAYHVANKTVPTRFRTVITLAVADTDTCTGDYTVSPIHANGQ
jgi:hypothetical protein